MADAPKPKQDSYRKPPAWDKSDDVTDEDVTRYQREQGKQPKFPKRIQDDRRG